MANRRRDAGREGVWRRTIRRQAHSGLSVRAFCRRAGVTEPSFYAWRRTIARRDGERKPLRVPHRPKAKAHGAAFVPLVVTEGPAWETGIVLEVRGGRRLRLPDTMAVERLAQLVRALEADVPVGEATR